MLTEPTISIGTASEGTRAILTDLWRRRLDTLISGIANGDPYYQQIANAAEHISAEYQGRFLIELLQNANDQAVRVGLTDSLVTIVRTDGLIAVGNSGQPFDQDKVDAITSIFKSDKTADECIGNKGIGFKAVFQIADSAEIFSSAPSGSLAHECAIAFRMARRPFDDADFVAEIRMLASGLLERYNDRQRAIEDRFSGEVAVDVVLREASRAAWFTFPLPLTHEQFATRVAQLGLFDELLSTTQTLIVLPLDGESQSFDRVSLAIDEIQGGDEHSTHLPPGASFLFLPGIGRISMIDHVRGFRAEIEKKTPRTKEDLGDGVLLCRRQTIGRRIQLSKPDLPPASNLQEWWVVERMIGGRGDGDGERVARERQAIRNAIQALRLPAENWKDVEQVPIAVALPDPSQHDENVIELMGAGGRFCIGLPTQVQTGLPLWVSAHFHGKIDRTAIDFENAYNGLLFSASVDLAAALIERLKRETSKATQRLVTLMMERGTGKLADTFYADDGLARMAVVLNSDGTFIKATHLTLPKESDLAMFDQIVAGVSDLNVYGFHLPDRLLLANARRILDGLAENIEAGDSQYLQRPPNMPSLLEHACRQHRTDGPSFWEPFLTWVLDRFSTHQSEALDTQTILPTASAGLASASSRVFFPPMSVAARVTEEKERPHAIDDAGDELATIDENVALLLKFYDDSVIKVRTGTARDYTALAQKLAPAAGGGLVRRPRQADLINDALIPALKASTNDNDRALALLRQALIWLVGMSQKSKQRVSSDELLVPVRGQGDSWEWVEPDKVYFGEGWSPDPNISLITRAFGSRHNSQLIPWDRFEKKLRQLFKVADRDCWLHWMREIGVWDCPRIIRTDRRLVVAQSDSYTHLTAWSVPCPTECPHAIWHAYLAHICQRRANTKSGQQFSLDEVSWVDGLETEPIRATVMEAMLRKPDRYEPFVHTRLSRGGGEDSSEVPSLWVYALQSQRWAVIPTSFGLRIPHDAWFLPSESRSTKADRFTFLPCAKAQFSAARGLLRNLGVITIEEASIPRLVTALHELANRVMEAETESLRHINALAADLYEAIQARLKAGESAEGLKTVVDAPVPLLRDEQIDRVSLKEIRCVIVDDDALRRQHILGFEHSWVIPKRFHQAYNELISALRGLLGTERVVRVSECRIDVQFEPMEEGVILLDYLRKEFPGRSLAEDIALLIVKGGTQATSPQEDTFRRAWAQILHTSVVRGTFAGPSPPRACFDAQHGDGPILMVDSRLQPHDIVGEIWRLVGPSYRDIWAAYAHALKEGPTEQFFEERGVSSTERTEVEAAIGLGFEQRLRRYMPVCLANWRRHNISRSLDDFHYEWARSAKTPETASTWLAWKDVQAHVELASQEDEPHGSLSILARLGLSIQEWQNARRELGDSPWRFGESEQIYKSARDAIAGHMMALFAYLVVPRASGSSGPTLPPSLAAAIGLWVEQIRQLPVPDDVAQQPLLSNIIAAHAAWDAVQIAAAITDVKGVMVLVDPLQDLAMSAPTEIASIRLKDEPDKAATVYERDDEIQRSQQATEAVNTVLRVARDLAQKHGETLEDTVVWQEPFVVLLSQGAWANRVSVLAALRYALENATPATASRMKERQAFRDLDDWRTLWQKFEELGEIPKPATPPPPKLKFEVLGSEWTEDEFSDSAAAGPTGELAQRLQEAIISGFDLVALRSIPRHTVQGKSRRPGSGSGGGSGMRKRVPDQYLKMLGAIGEYFVYQQLKTLFPDFDVTNWRSKGRELFGYSDGDDSLGYDFEYYDISGKLTGTFVASRCLIEVKSAAHECSDSFEMSTNEWETALRCHNRRENAVYVIIRVAGTASKPHIVDILVDPVEMHLHGILDYSSRDLLVAVGKPMKSGLGQSL